MSRAYVPIRMCMGCGQRSPQAQLVRLRVSAGGQLAISTPSSPGRSGYLHGRRECWQQFTGRKGPLRSLGASFDKAARIRLVEHLGQVSESVA